MPNENDATGHVARRQQSYKNFGRDVEESRRRRAETSVELRKQKKEDTLLKRRNIEISDNEPTSPLQENNKATMSMNEIVVNIDTTDPQRVFDATQGVRKLLSKERNPPIDRVIEAGLVQRLARFLEANDRPHLQFEAAWALTNIASGTTQQTKAVVNAGAVPHFVRLLRSENSHLVEQCVWALGNIAGDGAEMRDYVISAGVIEPLTGLVRMDAAPSFLRNVTWTFSNLCRNKTPPPKMKTIQACIPALSTLIQHSDKEVLADACWAFSYITDGANTQIQEVVNCPAIIHRLVELLGCNDPSVITPALRSVGNIVTGDDDQTQVVIEMKALQMLPALLQHQKCSIKKEACWMLSNITAGSVEQIQAALDSNLLPLVIEVLRSGDFKSQKEAVWVLTNMTTGGDANQVMSMVHFGAIVPLCNLLLSKDSKLLMVILEGIANTLRVACEKMQIDDSNHPCLTIEECGGLDKIEELQQHENEQIYKKAQSIIEEYFSGYEEDNEVAPSAAADGSCFQFNVPQGDNTISF